MSEQKALYFNAKKDYKKLLLNYYNNGYSTSWLYGYTACLYGSLIIDEKKRFGLDCLIGKLRDKEIKEIRNVSPI